MRKFNSKKHPELLFNLPFSYVSVSPFLDYFCYIIEKNNSQEIVIKHPEQPQNFPYLFIPKNELNWENSQILWVTKKELESLRKRVKIIRAIPLGNELYYKTKDFISPEGKKWGNFRKQINHFKKNYSFAVSEKAPKKEIDSFLKRWVNNKKKPHNTRTDEEDLRFFKFCLQKKFQYPIKFIFVLIGGKVVGVSMGAKFNSSCWVGLHLKLNYRIKGLGRFLEQERAKLFSECETCSLGGEVLRSKGIKEFKHRLNPIKLIPHYYVVTGKAVDKK